MLSPEPINILVIPVKNSGENKHDNRAAGIMDKWPIQLNIENNFIPFSKEVLPETHFQFKDL